jgi:hypothetical protein
MTNRKISILFLLIVLFSLTVSAYENIINLQFNITNNDEVALSYAKVISGYPDKFTKSEQPYSIKTYSKSGNEINSEYFQVSFSILTSPEMEWNVNSTLKELSLQHNKSIETIKIFHNGKEIFSFSASEFCRIDGLCNEHESEISCPEDCLPKNNNLTNSGGLNLPCGNAVCDSTETYFNCPKDCSSGGKDSYCDRVRDGKCDPDCKASEDSDCTAPIKNKQEDSVTKILIAAIFGVIILFITLFLIIKMKTGSEK